MRGIVDHEGHVVKAQVDRLVLLTAGLFVLAMSVLFFHRSWTGRVALALLLLGAIQLVRLREWDAVDTRFLAVVALIPGAYMLNMLIHGFSGPLLDRPARMLGGFFLFYLMRRVAVPSLVVFDACAVAAGSAGLVAAYEVWGEEAARADATWNAVPFGNYAVLLTAIAACGLFGSPLRGDTVRSAFAYPLAIALGLAACLLSGTRGSLLAVPVLIVLAACAAPRLRTVHVAASFVALAMVGMLAVIAMPRMQERLSGGLDDVRSVMLSPDVNRGSESSLAIRLRMWRWGLQRFAEHPVAGIGVVNYGSFRAKAVSDGVLSSEFLGLANVHNELIHALAVGGLLMGIPLIAFWVLASSFFLRRLRAPPGEWARPVAAAGLCVVIGTAVFSMSGGLFGTNPDATAFVILLSVFGGLAARDSDA